MVTGVWALARGNFRKSSRQGLAIAGLVIAPALAILLGFVVAAIGSSETTTEEPAASASEVEDSNDEDGVDAAVPEPEPESASTEVDDPASAARIADLAECDLLQGGSCIVLGKMEITKVKGYDVSVEVTYENVSERDIEAFENYFILIDPFGEPVPATIGDGGQPLLAAITEPLAAGETFTRKVKYGFEGQVFAKDFISSQGNGYSTVHVLENVKFADGEILEIENPLGP